MPVPVSGQARLGEDVREEEAGNSIVHTVV